MEVSQSRRSASLACIFSILAALRMASCISPSSVFIKKVCSPLLEARAIIQLAELTTVSQPSRMRISRTSGIKDRSAA